MTAQKDSSSDTGTSSSAIDTSTSSSLTIVGVTCSSDSSPPENPILREGVAELFKLYFDELYELGCDLGFQGFQSEWTDLPGKYDFQKRGGLFVALDLGTETAQKEDGFVFVPPGKDLHNSNDTNGDGKILPTLNDLLIDSKQVVGCIAIRPLTETCGEVKRMYIRKSHRRRGVGKLLATTIMKHAWGEDCSFKEVKLDSLERLEGAVKLYENIGFQRIEPYCECPEKDHVCMNLFKDV